MNTTLARLALLALVTVGACTNPETPAGYEGYIYHTPLVFGKMAYRDTLRGPASTGVSWRLYVINVDMRAKTFAEEFSLLTKDDLSVSFHVNTRIQLRPGSIKDVVEGWGGENWYVWNVKEPLRTVVRRTLTEVSAVDIQLETEVVKQKIHDTLVKKYEGTPIEILSVDIGHIEFPQAVTDAIQLKIAKQQELERQDFVLAKTRKEAAIHVLEALKTAKQQKIISATLDPLYVQRRAVQVYKVLAQASNRTIVMLPNTDDSTGMPLVLANRQHKVASPAELKLLEEMEAKYMKIASEPTPESSAVPSPTGPDSPPVPAPAPSPAPSPAPPSPSPPPATP